MVHSRGKSDGFIVKTRTSEIEFTTRDPTTGAVVHSGTATGSFEDDEVHRLALFHEEAKRLQACRLVRQGLPRLEVTTTDATGIRFIFSHFDSEDAHAAFHLARPLILEKEPGSFKRTASLLVRRFENEYVRTGIKKVQRLYDDGHHRSYMQIRTNGTDMFDEKTFQLWLNARQYHRDGDKAKAIQDIEPAFGRENTDNLLLLHFSAKVEAIITLNTEVVERVLAKLKPVQDANS